MTFGCGSGRASPCSANPDSYNKHRKLSDDWLNGNPAVPGGLLKSKPTWGDIAGCAPPRRLFLLDFKQGCDVTESFLCFRIPRSPFAKSL
jgi:hypothetical protein